MLFEDELRDYLERPSEAFSRISDLRPREADLRRHALTRLRELESAGRLERASALASYWLPRLGALTRHLEWHPALEPFARPGDAFSFAILVIDSALGTIEPSISLADLHEANKVRTDFIIGRAPRRYAHETQLVVATDASSVKTTRVGQTFLRLKGRDAIRWLLTLEIAESTGPWDPWRAPRILLSEASSEPGIVGEYGDGADPYTPTFGYAETTLERLRELGVLEGSSSGPEIDHYRVARDLRDVVDVVIQGGPWEIAARALLEEERPPGLAPAAGNSEALTGQARLIIHEVRNSLVPVRHHLTKQQSHGFDSVRMTAAVRGVVRVLEFVDEMAQMMELFIEPSVTFDIADAARDATRWSGEAERITLTVEEPSSMIRAPRVQLARAVLELIRNALQAGPEAGRVAVTVSRNRIIVDDEGPGVLPELRDEIFREGVTTRQGGSGFGLAHARRIAVDILQGKIWCDENANGGARFIIEAPEQKDQP